MVYLTPQADALLRKAMDVAPQLNSVAVRYALCLLSWYIARGRLKTKAAPALYGKLAITHSAQLTTVRKRTTLGSVMATAAHRGHTFFAQPLPQSRGALLRKAMNVAPQLNSVAVR
ncbi:hypothetical protein [Salinivibrio sp. ES.052]|uniref:hypothetical protein n=1 Tax=Salinivibrio sp. ES.052 TaxID=1882823 RepID=UPI001587FCCF|nr:hypothetical protein [Salinivibrio sp. ES.052]